MEEKLFEKTFMYSTIGMALVGLDGKWLKVNPGLSKMLGYTEDEFYNLTFQDITHPDDLNKDLKLLQKTLHFELDSYQLEKRYFHKNGTIVWALLSVALVKDADRPMHFISQITNITQQKQAEKQIRALLDVTQNQNTRLLDFAHIVSHNLRSHSGNLTMLIDLIKIENPEFFQNEFLPLLEQAVGNLRDTIKHLNEIVLINSQQKSDTEIVNLTNQIKQAISNLSPELAKTSCNLHNTINEDIFIEFSSTYLENIITNLLSNAIKFRSENRPLEIIISAKKTTDQVIFSITDNGLGIDLDKHREKLFGMYKTFHPKEGSRGIGLFITKYQIEAMQASIEVESKVDQGSTFTIYFNKKLVHEEI